ncbi:amino acid permease [Candidatus Woesearchaeota archaeon]|nr:amino acid permease [Candidatus Woesearchaeota archaeon]
MPQLKRELGLFDITLAGVAVILGAGIYALVGVAAGNAGNAVWISFVISAIVAMFTALSYAELSAMFKGDSGEYDYVKSAMGNKFGFVIALSMIFGTIISSAAVALGFAGYFTRFFPIPIVVAALGLIGLMTLLNVTGIKETKYYNAVSTVLEMLGLIIIIVAGFMYSKPGTNYFEMPNGFSGVVSSAALVFFAYLGFEGIVKLREETRNPTKNIPLGMLLALAISTVLYVMVSYAAVGVLGWQDLSASNAPLASVAAMAFGGTAFLILGIIALFSTSNTVLMTMVAASRQLYGMAEEKSMPKLFSKVGRTGTPYVAIFVTGIIAVIFSLMGDLELVANLTNLFLFLAFVAVNLSLIILRYTHSFIHRPFKCPLNAGKFNLVALMGVLTSLGMICVILTNLL